MSYFIQAKGNAFGQTIDKGTPIYTVASPSFYQIDESMSFNPTTGLKPGQKTICDVKFINDKIQRIEHGFIVFDASTTDATNSATWNNVCEFCQSIAIRLNDGNIQIKYDDPEIIRSLFGEGLLEYGLNMYQFMNMITPTLNSLTGYTITSSASQRIYFPIFLLYPYLQREVINNLNNRMDLKNMNIEFTFRQPADTAAGTGKFCVSTTTANPYTASSYEFNNVHYMTIYTSLHDTRLVSAPSIKNVKFPVYEIYKYNALQAGSWTNVGTDKVTLKASQVAKVKNVQFGKPYVEPVGAAYNTATNTKHYSGAKYIKWKYEEIGGAREKLDMTEQKLLYGYEIEAENNNFGDLPIELFTQSTTLTAQYCDMTHIYFDNNKIEKWHSNLVSPLDTSVRDFDITLVCAGSVGASCNVIVMLYAIQWYMFNEQYQLVKVDSPVETKFIC